MADESKWKKHLGALGKHAKGLAHLKTLGQHAKRIKEHTRFSSLRDAFHHARTKSLEDDKQIPGTSKGQRDSVTINIGSAIQADLSKTKFRRKKTP